MFSSVTLEKAFIQILETILRGVIKMTAETSKNLSGVGALLIVIGCLGFIVPYAGILLLIGIILLLIGMKGFADHYQEGGIFNNVLYALILGIVGAVVAVATIVITAIAALASLGINLTNVTDWATFGTELANRFTDFANFGPLLSLIGSIIAGLIVLFVFVIIAAFLLRRSFTFLSAKTGVGLFGTAGILMLIGAVLTIVLIGFLLIWIAWILVTVAFFQIKTQTVQLPPQPPS
jgi:uncharacterized membrane protein